MFNKDDDLFVDDDNFDHLADLVCLTLPLKLISIEKA